MGALRWRSGRPCSRIPGRQAEAACPSVSACFRSHDVRLLQGTELLAEFPEPGEVWGGESRPDLRSIVHESHRVVYRVRADEIAILSARHTRRDVEANEE